VTVTNANGCSATSTPTVVTVNPLPSPTITPDGPTTFCNGGSVTLTAANATNYLWSTGATSQSITVATAGSYSVTVTNANGCSATSTPTVVTVNPLPTATIEPSGDKTFCDGGSVILTAATATNYLWNTGATSQSISVTTSGAYSVTVTNANGCSASSTPTVVTVYSLPTPTIEPSGATTVCNGGSATLTAATATSYLWSTGATSQIISVTTSGSYSVTVTNANGCSTTSAPTAVTVNPLPTPTIESDGATTFCDGGSVILTAATATNYLWSTGATSQSITVITAGAYSVTVTIANGCSTTSAPTAVTVYSLPTPTIESDGATTFCDGGSVILTAATATSYLWSTGAISQSIIVSNAGSFSVTVTNTAGCSATSAPTVVTVNPLPTATITASGSTTFCDGGSVTLTATTATNYLWSTGATSQSIAVANAGSYSVTVTNAAGCSASSVPMVVTVNPLPTATITASGSTTFCDGGSVTLTATTAASYLWSTGAISQSIIVITGGSYTVTVTNAAGCSASSVPIIVTVNPIPAMPVVNNIGYCQNDPSSPLQAIPDGSNIIRWYRFTLGGLAIATPSFNTLLPSVDSFYVTQTTIFGCESPRAPLIVTIHPLPEDSILTPTQNFICEGSFLTLSASNNYTYQWLNNGLPIAGALSNNYLAHLEGTYTFQMTSEFGCVNHSNNSISIQLIKKPTADFTFDNRCINTPIRFMNTSNMLHSATVLWDFGNGTVGKLKDGLSIYDTIGKYTVTLSATSSVCPHLVDTAKKVLSIEAPVPGIHYGAENAKANRPHLLNARKIGTTYLWDPFRGLSNPSIQNPTTSLQANQVYTIRITNNAGCITQDTLLVWIFNDYGVYVPSGFSPDGDGVNDKLTPILIGIREVKSFRIYNRWGQLVYQTSEKNEGWNGIYKGGAQLSETYAWVIAVINEEGELIQKTGKSTLIR
jgi:gliding motility-associated-like protein